MTLSEAEARRLRELEQRKQRAEQSLDPNAPPGERIYLSLTAYEEALLRELRQRSAQTPKLEREG